MNISSILSPITSKEQIMVNGYNKFLAVEKRDKPFNMFYLNFLFQEEEHQHRSENWLYSNLHVCVFTVVYLFFVQTRLEPVIEEAVEHELKKSSKRTLPADCGDSIAKSKRGSVSAHSPLLR